MDRRELDLPPVGYVEFEDAESGDHVLVNTSDRRFRVAFRANAERARHLLEETFRKTKVDVIEVQTGEPYVEPLMQFFRERARRFR
jgi:CRISPR/Cas system-associated protein Cas5 (RAMP superfamily)